MVFNVVKTNWLFEITLMFHSDDSIPYDCQEEGTNYLARELVKGEFGSITMNSWQECQQKCAEVDPCKFWVYHTERNPMLPKGCRLAKGFD